MLRNSFARVTIIFLLILWFTGICFAWEEKWEEIGDPELVVDVGVKRLIREQNWNVPDPQKTWMENKAIDALKRGAKNSLSMTGIGDSFIGNLGVVSSFVKELSPNNYIQSKIADFAGNACKVHSLLNPQASIGGKLYTASTYLVGDLLLDSNFDPNATVGHSETITLNQSWNDSFSTGSVTGTVEFTRTFEPDAHSWSKDTYSWGTYTESYKVLDDITTISRSGGDVPSSLCDGLSLFGSSTSGLYNPSTLHTCKSSTTSYLDSYSSYEPPTYTTYGSTRFGYFGPSAFNSFDSYTLPTYNTSSYSTFGSWSMPTFSNYNSPTFNNYSMPSFSTYR